MPHSRDIKDHIFGSIGADLFHQAKPASCDWNPVIGLMQAWKHVETASSKSACNLRASKGNIAPLIMLIWIEEEPG